MQKAEVESAAQREIHRKELEKREEERRLAQEEASERHRRGLVGPLVY
jgi:hypothetical protein